MVQLEQVSLEQLVLEHELPEASVIVQLEQIESKDPSTSVNSLHKPGPYSMLVELKEVEPVSVEVLNLHLFNFQLEWIYLMTFQP
jgi:hypothetical protein